MQPTTPPTDPAPSHPISTILITIPVLDKTDPHTPNIISTAAWIAGKKGGSARIQSVAERQTAEWFSMLPIPGVSETCA